MLHDPEMAKRAPEHAGYADINDWWRGQGTCINGSCRKFQKALDKDQAKKRKLQEVAAEKENEAEEEEEEAKLPWDQRSN